MDIDIEDHPKLNNESTKKIHWTPTINTIIPETYQCTEQSDEDLTEDQQTFIEEIQGLINETRITGLCCESV